MPQVSASPLDATPNWLRPVSEAVAVLLVLCLAAFIAFNNLGGSVLSPFDEARHAQNALEMLRSGDWVASSYGGKPDFWNLKPPLGAWLMASSFAVLGPSEFSVRLTSALAGLGTLTVVYFFGRSLSGGLTGLAAVLILLANPAFFGWHGCRTGDHDALLCFFVTLAMASYHRGRLRQDPRWLHASALALGLAVLAKGAAGLLPLLAIGLPPLLARSVRARGFAARHWLAALALFALVVAPWAILRALRGDGFFETMLRQDLFRRFSEPIEGHVGGPLFYVYQLRASLRWPLMAGLALSVLAAAVSGKRRRGHGLLIAWMAAFLVPFSLAGSKLGWYILPVYPAVSLLLADSFVALQQRFRIPTYLAVLALAALLARPITEVAAATEQTSGERYTQAIRALAGPIQGLRRVLIHTPEAGQDAFFYLSLHAKGVTVFPSFFKLTLAEFRPGDGLLTANPDFRERLLRRQRLRLLGSIDGVWLFVRLPAGPARHRGD